MRPARVYAAPRAAAIKQKLPGWSASRHMLTACSTRQKERPAQVALAEGQQTDPPGGKHEATEVINSLGNLQPFFPKGSALSERAQFGMACGKVGTGVHRGQENLTKALAE